MLRKFWDTGQAARANHEVEGSANREDGIEMSAIIAAEGLN